MAPVKIPFTESHLTSLSKRYSSSTIVTMLREVASCKTVKLDWARLCKGSATGITNPKEYQALWRSLAYRAELDDSFDDDESPLEDESDLEVDLDPVPSVAPAIAATLSSFVKADLQQHVIEEARVEQNVVGLRPGDGPIPRVHLQQGTSLVGKPEDAAARGVPHLAPQAAVAQGEPPAAALTCSTSKAAFSGAMNQSDRKRRRLWTPEEDLALIAAVDKCGEGNWTTVLKNHHDFDRSASQLSQRWALIRKRREVQEKAGYAGSGVSLLATGYKDVRPEGAKPGGSGSQLGTPKEVGKQGDKSTSSGSVPMPIKQPLSSAPAVPVSKRLPAAASPETSVLETQRVRASGGASSWTGAPGQRPHNQGAMRGASGGGQAHKGGAPEVRRPAPGGASAGGQMFYTSSQAMTPTVPIDSKYAASRSMGAGGARGGSKGVHGPDPMIQAAAMAAGARIAPAATAASLLKAAQSGNVVHIGSGGLPRSKLGQAGSGNAGGSPGIVHYIRTGSGGASLATTSSGLQRTSSHHMQKTQSNQPSRGLGNSSGSHPAGNSSPLSATTVPPQGSRNTAQAPPAQASKQISTSKRGSSPQQQKTSPSAPSPTLTLAPVPASTPAPTPAIATPAATSTATPAATSVATPAATSIATPAATPVSTPASAPASTSAPTLTSTSAPAPTSIPSQPSTATSAQSSTSTPPATSVSAAISTSASTSAPAPAPVSVAPSVSASGARPSATPSTAASAPKSTPAPSPAAPVATSSAGAPAPKSTPAPSPAAPVATSSSVAPAPKSTPAPASTPICGFNTAESVAEEGTTP